MDTKNIILRRITIIAWGLLFVCFLIIIKLVNIVFVNGKFWKNYSDSLYVMKRPLQSERGSIFSEDGNILSASLPFYDIFIDFGAQQMVEEKGKLFKRKVDSLANSFATLFKDKTTAAYKAELIAGHKAKERFYHFYKKATYQEYLQIKQFPFIRLAKNKFSSGFIFETHGKRVYPYGQLANRTIGFLRDSANWNLGLEKAYDSVLSGEQGFRMMKYIAAGSFAPLEGYDITPQNGKDIITTLNMTIQDIAQSALEAKMKFQDAEWGTCIVMDVITGKIRAMVNLTHNKKSDTAFFEHINYAIKRYEPGSTFKLFSMMALLDDGFVKLTDKVDLNSGQLEYGKGAIMYDSEKHGLRKTGIIKAFSMSSNVGISRLVSHYYNKNPQKYYNHLRQIHFLEKTGFDLNSEEINSRIALPRTKDWNTTTSMPWMSIGYGIEITPLQTLMLFNAVANNGVMMKPYLVSKIVDQGLVLQDIKPKILNQNICKPSTILMLKSLLQSVVDSGTATKVFKNAYYKVAGKTGTNLFYERGRAYKDSTYLSSFVGYFPAEAPKYSCIVVIKNKEKTLSYHGSAVSAPVFKNIADRLMALDKNINPELLISNKIIEEDKKTILIQTPKIIINKNTNASFMPNVLGLNLIKAIEILEQCGLKVEIEGDGIVKKQNIITGTKIEKKMIVKLSLG